MQQSVLSFLLALLWDFLKFWLNFKNILNNYDRSNILWEPYNIRTGSGFRTPCILGVIHILHKTIFVVNLCSFQMHFTRKYQEPNRRMSSSVRAEILSAYSSNCQIVLTVGCRLSSAAHNFTYILVFPIRKVKNYIQISLEPQGEVLFQFKVFS